MISAITVMCGFGLIIGGAYYTFMPKTTAFQVPLTPKTIKASTTFLRREGVTCKGTQQKDLWLLVVVAF